MNPYLRKLALLLSAILIPLLGLGQNLVPNPGFETFTACPSASCEWFLASDWDNVNGSLACNVSAGSPDYFNTCGTGFFGTPNTLNGEVNPLAGNGIMGLATWVGFSNNFREYLQVQLNSPLVAGNTYTLDFAYTNGDFDPTLSYGGRGTELGVHFSVGPLTQNGSNPIILTPTFETVGAIFSVNWQTISFTFTAVNNATHIIFGNFRNDANSTVQQFAASSSSFGYAYYYFDEISVIEQSALPVEWLQVEATARPSEAVLKWVVAPLYEETRFFIERSEDGQNFNAIGEQLANPGESVFSFRDAAVQNDQYYYRLRYQGADGQSSLSRVMKAKWEGETDFVWYYDANSRKVIIERSPQADRSSSLLLYDLSGRLVYEDSSEAESFLLPSDLRSGLYILVLAQEGSKVRKKLWVQ
ncbi:MAG: T9SS type A sorting domain-containing protein [Bacteroidota bacterium]